MIRRLRDEIGVHKLMWGTDMPYCSGSWCTYKQALDYIRLHCEFLSADEKALILGDNAARMFNLL
jgi:predicted TIM-barrel fold metal-dependent hydrolase